MYKRLLSAALLTLSAVPASADDHGCGNVTIADMNWNSASLIANIDQFILEHGYGCDAELVPGDTMPTGTSMIEKGEPDIAPEFWSNSMREGLQRGIDEGRIRYAGQAFVEGGEEGFWVPKYMVDQHPELKTISGVKANADLFPHPEDPSKAAFYGCPAGWSCQITSENNFKALDLADSSFEIVDPGSGAGLAGSIAKAYEREEAWFGYYWAPTAVLGKYEMVKVDFETGTDVEHYKSCITSDECITSKATMYPAADVETVVTERFAKRAPEAMAYIENRGFTNDQMNGLLAWMEDNQADGEYAMINFLINHEDIWTQWVPNDVASKVKDAL